MKKFTGRYTTNTAKALKGSERILCQVSEDGTIYICNGFLLCTMNPPEYAATVQPLTCCEPGNWTFDKDGKHEDDAHKLDLVRLYADTVRDTADAQPLQRSPLTVQTPKAAAVCYYNAAADFAAIYDTKFIAALHPAAQLRTTSAISAAVAYCDDEPFAVVMPIKAEPETVRAIRAFFTEAAEDNAKTDEADKLRAELAQAQEEAAALRGDLYRAANEIDELKNKLAELHETKTEQPAADARTQDRRRDHRGPLGRGGRPDRHHQGRDHRRAGCLAGRRHKAPRKRDRSRRGQVERQEERLLFPRRITKPKPKRPAGAVRREWPPGADDGRPNTKTRR